MQLFVNNWSAALTASATAVAVQITVDPAESAKLTGLGSGDYYLLTLAMLDGGGSETAWEVVRVTGKASGVLDVVRAQEGTTALIWASGAGISARATKGTLEQLRDSGSAAAPAAVVTEPTTSRSLGLTDAGKYIRHTNASASTVTVPPQDSVAWAADTETHHRCAGAGNLTLTAGAGVTLTAPSGGTLALSSGMTVTIKRVAEDAWDVIGQTVPA